MIYPVIIHKDADSCYGVTIPDIPGCFTAGETMVEALVNIQEAVECHLHDSDTLPEPSDIERYLYDPMAKNGIWAIVDIDNSFIKKSITLNTSLKSGKALPSSRSSYIHS